MFANNQIIGYACSQNVLNLSAKNFHISINLEKVYGVHLIISPDWNAHFSQGDEEDIILKHAYQSWIIFRSSLNSDSWTLFQPSWCIYFFYYQVSSHIGLNKKTNLMKNAKNTIKLKKRTIEYLNNDEMKSLNGGGGNFDTMDTTLTITITHMPPMNK